MLLLGRKCDDFFTKISYFLFQVALQDNNDMTGPSLTEHMEPLQIVTFTTTSNLGQNDANSLSQLMVSLYLSIIHFNVINSVTFG